MKTIVKMTGEGWVVLDATTRKQLHGPTSVQEAVGFARRVERHAPVLRVAR